METVEDAREALIAQLGGDVGDVQRWIDSARSEVRMGNYRNASSDIHSAINELVELHAALAVAMKP